MRLNLFVSLVLAFFSSLAVAIESQTTLEVFVWPLSAAKSTSLARVSYNSTSATVISYTNPKLVSDDEVVRVGFYHPSGSWSGVATSAANFAGGKDRLLRLLVDAQGQLYHVGFLAYDKEVKDTKKKAGDSGEGIRAEVEKRAIGPELALNKPVAVKADGTADEPEQEKTFLQKYWWVIGGFIAMQVLIGGGKD